MTVRVAIYVDGLNLQHSLTEFESASKGFMGLNIDSLGRRLLRRSSETLVKIDYFVAKANHIDASTRVAQADYLERLAATGVQVHLGAFRHRTSKCQKCGLLKHSFVEKETDVNLAVALVVDAFRDVYDRALIFSADSDLRPAVSAVLTHFPSKQVHIVSTETYLRPVYRTLVQAATGRIRLTPELVLNHQFN